MKRAWELKKGDKASHWDWILIFNKMDWGYAQFINLSWEIEVGHADWYKLGEDWIYYPIN